MSAVNDDEEMQKYDGWKKVENGWEYNSGWGSCYTSNKPIYIKKVKKHWELQQATAGDVTVLGKYRFEAEAFLDFRLRRENESRKRSDQYERDRLRSLEHEVKELAATLGFERDYFGKYIKIEKTKPKKAPAKKKIEAKEITDFAPVFEEFFKSPVFVDHDVRGIRHNAEIEEEHDFGCLGKHKWPPGFEW